MEQGPEIKRALFGYSKQDVESILEARERMFERVTEEASRRASEAEDLRRELGRARDETASAREEAQSVRGELKAQLDDLRSELEGVRLDLARSDERRRDADTRAVGLETELREARREVAGLNERLRVADATEADLRSRLDEAAAAAPDTRELGSVLEATQEAIARIMAGARRTAEDDLERVRSTRDGIQAEIERVRDWRERIDPLTDAIASGIAVAQAQMSQTAERVGEALRPMSDALTTLSQELEELARIADPTRLEGPPDRVDLVSHEQDRTTEGAGPDERSEANGETAARQEAAAGAVLHPDPWPDPWR